MSAKRIVLIYISEVSGHHSATLAIEQAVRKISPETEVLNINGFNYTTPIAEKVINRIYMSVIKRAPGIWNFLYDNPKVAKKLEKIKKRIHKFNSPKFKQLFDEFRPDAVLCTQAYPCGMVADYKKTYGANIPLIAVLTDYVPHSYWVYDDIDYYVTPSEDVSDRLAAKGVAREKIRSLGIPFDPKFTQPVGKEAVCRKLGLKPDVPTILIMGGGHGLGPIKSIVGSLEKFPGELQEIVVAGANKKLYRSLSGRLAGLNKKVLLFPFVDNIHELMAVSDIIVTKPGGVTTAEVLAKKIPMVIVSPIPGQEENNTEYLTQKGAAIKTDDPENIHLCILELLSGQEKLKAMREAEEKIAKPNSSMDIARLALEQHYG